MNRNLAIIGASYLQLPLIEKAKEMGYTAHVFAWAAGDVGESAADYFYPVSIVEKDEILEKCREIGICGICSIASDLAMVTVNYVAQSLGLCSNSIQATKKSTNKHLMRLAFEAGGDPSPKSIQVDEFTNLDSLKLTYPVIVKPTDRSGSRGIYKITEQSQLTDAVAAAMEQGFEKKVLVEEFAEGQEYSVEYISYEGEHHFLALTHKYTTGAPHFIETGHMQPAPVDADTLKRVQQVVTHALDTLELRFGASHTELKITEDGTIRIIEIGGRMGGDCIGSHLVRYSTGPDFVKMVIDVACGKKPEIAKESLQRAAAIRFVYGEEDLRILENIRKDKPMYLKHVSEIKMGETSAITDSASRFGFYITAAETLEEVRQVIEL